MHGIGYRARLAAGLLFVIFLLGLTTHPTMAATKTEGLFITPLREYVTLDAGKSISNSVTIANLTEKQITVTLSVEQFSVADYTYKYNFKPLQYDWVKLEQTAVELKPNRSQRIHYTITVPSTAAPGGQYFTIFATTKLSNGTASSQVQAATVLYLTVNGKLRKATELRKHSIPTLSLGKDLTFTLEIQNTGNTHFFTYVSGELNGMFTNRSSTETTHLLLPDTNRIVGGTIPAPMLPGVYRASYGYKTDDGQTIRRSRYIAFIPLWSLAIPLGLGWLLIVFRRHRRARLNK